MEHVRLGDEAAAKITAENFEDAVSGKIPVYDAIYAYQRPVDGRVVWIHALGHVEGRERQAHRHVRGDAGHNRVQAAGVGDASEPSRRRRRRRR